MDGHESLASGPPASTRSLFHESTATVDKVECMHASINNHSRHYSHFTKGSKPSTVLHTWLLLQDVTIKKLTLLPTRIRRNLDERSVAGRSSIEDMSSSRQTEGHTLAPSVHRPAALQGLLCLGVLMAVQSCENTQSHSRPTNVQTRAKVGLKVVT